MNTQKRLWPVMRNCLGVIGNHNVHRRLRRSERASSSPGSNGG